MTKLIERIKTWIFFNNDLISVIVILSILVIVYYQINSKREVLDSIDYTEIVKLKGLEFEKFYTTNFYSTERKLDKIVFDIDYEYQNKVYQNKTILYWEYITPKFEAILKNRNFERLIVKCNKTNPNQTMVYLVE